MALIVTTRHVFTIPGFSTRPGFCRGQARAWAARQGLDWRDFVRNGIDAEQLLATGDGFAIALVEWARKCEAQGQGNG
jgi:hypothetical protein